VALHLRGSGCYIASALIPTRLLCQTAIVPSPFQELNIVTGAFAFSLNIIIYIITPEVNK
jgi:hypothetical protein